MRNKKQQQAIAKAKCFLTKRGLALCLLTFSFSFSLSIGASEPPGDGNSDTVASDQNTTSVASEKQLYTRKGADTCLKCHDEFFDKYPVLEIFFTKHGDRQNPRSPMAQLQCESCHGPGRAHATEPKAGEKRAPIFVFGKKSKSPVGEQNAVCMQCHTSGNRMAWHGSAHQSQNMGCFDCHTIHKKKDPVLSVANQSEVCLACHKKQAAEFARSSVHPVRYGQMSCTQCHNPHGSFTDALLKTANKNDTCYTCHAEKRGPYLWTHAPVAEDCGLCHEHHGSIQKPLLKKRAPYLCQQCHTSANHPSIAFDNASLSNVANNTYVLAKGCLNCHFQVHGSNHPSGVKLMR